MAYSLATAGTESDPIEWGSSDADQYKAVTGADNAKLVTLTSNTPKDDGSLKKYATGHADVDGNFRGMSGEFVCSSDTNCAARKVSGGYELVGTWAFSPNAGSKATFTVTTSDASYAEYGWWLEEDGTTNTNRDGIRTFARFTSSSSDEIASFAGMSGPATYKGKAAGQVAVHIGPESDGNVAGNFEADAMLTASFGAEDTISGTINNFVIDGSSPGEWSVELMEKLHSGSAWGAAKTKWTMDGAEGDATGGWAVSLHEAGTTVGAISDPPKSAIGTFNSEHGTDAVMYGAFGAAR